MCDNWEFMTVNSYIDGFEPDVELVANQNRSRETPLPDLDMFENEGDDYDEVPTVNENGKEAPLLDIEMDWGSMGSDA